MNSAKLPVSSSNNRDCLNYKPKSTLEYYLTTDVELWDPAIDCIPHKFLKGKQFVNSAPNEIERNEPIVSSAPSDILQNQPTVSGKATNK